MGMRAFQIVIIAASSYFCCAEAAQSVDFALHSIGTTGSRLVIETEEEILVPSLSSVPLTQENLSRAIPSISSEDRQAILKELTGRANLSLGHASVYFYIAVNLAVERIYKSLLLGQGAASRSVEEKALIKDLDETYGGSNRDRDKTFGNLRDMSGIKPIENVVLRLKIFFSEDRFKQAAADVGLHAAQAFWDPATTTIGLHFDRNVFKWYRSRAAAGDASSGEAAARVRDYVMKQVLDRITHELVHAIQASNGQFLGHRPFVAEGAALLIQSNISLRDDLARIEAQMRARGLSIMPQPGSPCLTLFKASPPMYSSSLIQFTNGLDVARKGISLERILLLENEKFYGQSAAALKAQYDASLAFSIFASALPRERFRKVLMPIIRKGSAVDVAALKALSVDFKNWAQDQADDWWMAKGAHSTFDAVQRLTVACSDNEDYVMAFVGSQLLFALDRSAVMPFVHAGDVFKNLDLPFFALDYYARSKALAKDAVRRELEDQLDARLGDALVSLGDVEGALQWYSQTADVKRDGVLPESAFTWFELRLKLDFYQNALSAGYAHEEGVQALAASYVDEFYGLACIDQASARHIRVAMEALRADDLVKMWDTLQNDYEAVLSHLHADRADNTLAKAKAARFQYCEARR